MRDPYKMFNKLIEKNDKLKELAEQAKHMENDEILKLPVPMWQKKILSEIRMKKLLKKSIDDIPVKVIHPWEGIILSVRRMTHEMWVKQGNKENLFEVDHMIGITGENIFWGFTYLTGCENIDQIMENSFHISDMSKDQYLEYYRNTVTNRNGVIDQDDRFGNTNNNTLDAYGVKFK